METEAEKMNDTKKPKWLRALEAQSWQAELLISGLAIIGSIEATRLLNSLIDWTLVSFNEELLNFLQDVFTYLGIAIYSLIFCFVAHFVLRVLWIGVLGLNSVFPNGISTQTESSYSESFLEALKRDLSSSDEFSMKLERMSSTLFSIAALFTMIMIVSAIWIAIIVLIAYFVSNVQDVLSFKHIYFGFIFFIGFIALLFVLARNKRLSQFKWIERNQYKYYKTFHKTFLLGLYEPVTLINFIFITNIKRSKLTLYFIFLMMIIAIGAAFHLRTSNVYYFNQNKFLSLNSNTTFLQSENYGDEFGQQERIIRPQIQSRLIDEDYLILFIPTFSRENKYVFQNCSIHENTKNKATNGDEKSMKRLACYQAYYRIKVDSVDFNKVAPTFFKHSNRDEKGLLFMLPIDEISAGKHMLKIEKHYPTETKEFVTQKIPFWKSKNSG